MTITPQAPHKGTRLVGDPLLAESVNVPCWQVRVDVDIDADDRLDAASVVLADGRVATVVVQSAADAEALAAARIARAGSDLYAADAKPIAHAVADALVAAGYGSP